MHAAAETFAIVPRVGSEGRSLTGAVLQGVFSPIQTTLTLLDDGQQRICLISSHLMTHYYRFSNLMRQRVAEVLDLDRAQVLCFSSHNHSVPKLTLQQYAFGKAEREIMFSMDDLTWEGRTVVERACEVARRLPHSLQEARVHWALGHERRITHNRKGHRADGSTYLMREEDRLLLGDDFCGDIDDDAAVVAFVGTDNRPICFLTHFTGHPVTSFHPEHPIAFGEYPQVACDVLSAEYDCVPVGFLQGCAGDVNSKGLMANKPVKETVADATRYGQWLGQTFRQAAGALRPCGRQDLALAWKVVHLPFADVPRRDHLDTQITDMESFLERCRRNDPNTCRCQGLNFPSNMSPVYRAALVEPLLRWAQWARSFHEEGRLNTAPSGSDYEIAVVRIGDIGLIGLPCEPFDAIGRQIKHASSCALTLPCGYMNDTCLGYVPDSGNNGDIEYMSAFYRYTTTLLPYAQPAGDRFAKQSIRLLQQLSSGC